MKQRRILVLSYLYPNSQYPNHGIFVHNRIKAIAEHCQVRVINPIPWFPFAQCLDRYRNFDKIPGKETIDGIEVIHPRYFIIPGLLKSLDGVTYAWAVVRSLMGKDFSWYRNADLMDLHWTYPDLPAGYLLSKWLGKPFLVTLRGREALNIFVDPKNPSKGVREYSLRNLMTRFFLGRADQVIGLSRELIDLAREAGVEGKRTQVIINGVDRDRFHHIPQDQAREALGLSPRQCHILCVGSLTYRKGFDRVIRALARLRQRGSRDVHLHIIGSEGPESRYGGALEELCQQTHVEDRVHFHGQVPNSDLKLWYNGADLFCLASRGEGSPNVLFEALACGCPCVATRVGAVPEMIMDRSQGRVVANDDVGMETAMEEVLSWQRDRRANARLLDQRRWDHCARQVVSLYDTLLGKCH
ncbi:MAG: glycosyltransferase [Desulfobacterales bacterium]|nr:glycosyltransferase [Desulfobacterales bacterium]